MPATTARSGSGHDQEPRPRRAAHRPSRRASIVAAAIRVFAREGFVDASVQAVAVEAGVAPTAVYYHFAGKEALFDAALSTVHDAINAVVVQARADDAPGDPASLGHVIDAVWAWLEANPESCQLLYHHLPGSTGRARTLQDEFERLHVRRGFDYIVAQRPPRRRSTVAAHAAETLAVRTLISLTVLVHPMRSQDGPLARYPESAVQGVLREVSARIVTLS